MEDCLFCKIASGEVPSEIIYQDEDIVAFKDIAPQAPVHIVIIPVTHYDNILNIPAGNDIVSRIVTVVNRLAIKYGIAQTGFRLVNNCGEDGGQSVNHLHFHLLAGRPFGWPPG